jgi:SAM-dependent methyltransferase
MWIPHFACPECQAPLAGHPTFVCGCGQAWELTDGVFEFLGESRRQAARPFAAQYQHVRRADGHHAVTTTWWHTLPKVPRTHPAYGEWHIRTQSFNELAKTVLARSAQRILDLGAGTGWLSARCASMQHHVVAIDRFDDQTERHRLQRGSPLPFVVVQADFDALPFVPHQFDAAIFNASLHYAKDPARTLAATAQMLRPGGVLVVMDSPLFRRPEDGEQMVATQLATLAAQYELANVVRAGYGYLTFAQLEQAARRLGRRPRFTASHGTWAWRVRHTLAPWRLGRAPASFGVWVAQ